MRRDVDAKVFADAINGDGVLRVRVTTAAADNTIARVAIHDEDNALSILIVDGNIADAIALRDEPRADALAGLKALTGTGVRTVMLTAQAIHRATEDRQSPLAFEKGFRRRFAGQII